MKSITLVVLLLLSPALGAVRDALFNVMDFGALGDGQRTGLGKQSLPVAGFGSGQEIIIGLAVRFESAEPAIPGKPPEHQRTGDPGKTTPGRAHGKGQEFGFGELEGPGAGMGRIIRAKEPDTIGGAFGGGVGLGPLGGEDPFERGPGDDGQAGVAFALNRLVNDAGRGAGSDVERRPREQEQEPGLHYPKIVRGGLFCNLKSQV